MRASPFLKLWAGVRLCPLLPKELWDVMSLTSQRVKYVMRRVVGTVLLW